MTDPAPRKIGTYVGAPACFLLELACRQLNEAFGGECYLVGSALDRPNWRDVDVRLIMDDDDFAALFPHVEDRWEFDARWLLLTTALSAQLAKATGLPIDFQFQPRNHANKFHKGPRSALGLIFRSPKEKGKLT